MANFLPFAFVLYGATGDLARRRIVPALANLLKTGNMNPDTRIIGVGRKQKTNEQFLRELWEGMSSLGSNKGFSESDWGTFCRQTIPSPGGGEIPRLQYVACDVAEGDFSPLRTAIEETRKVTAGNIMHYLSVDPGLFIPIINRIHAAHLSGQALTGQSESRIHMEKPHGRNEPESVHLMDRLDAAFHREQQFRIDHQLAVDMFRDIVFTLRGSALCGWYDLLRRLVAIRIVAHETIGVESRSFLAEVGALADMVIGHLLGMFARLVADTPQRKGLQIQALSDAALDRIQTIHPKFAQRAWAEGLDPGSHRETFARITFPYQIGNEHWSPVINVVLESGKSLGPDKVTAIQLLFHPARAELTLGRPHEGPPLWETLTFVLAHKPGNPSHRPFVGTIRQTWGKKPGHGFILQPRIEATPYCLPGQEQADAYFVLLRKSMLEEAEHEVFAGRRQTEHSWRINSEVLRAWETPPADALFYPKGSNPSDRNGTLGSLLPTDWPYPKYVIPLDVLRGSSVQLVGP